MDFSFRTVLGLLFIVWGVSIVFNINLGRYIFPLFIIFVGFMLLVNQQTPTSLGKQTTSSEKSLNISGVFTGVNRKITTDDFKGGKVDMVFAGGEIDLRDAKIAKGTTVSLEINAVFGGVKILVPDTWVVNNAVTGVFGGFENSTKLPASGKETGRLNVKGAAVFGGGEVTNK